METVQDEATLQTVVLKELDFFAKNVREVIMQYLVGRETAIGKIRKTLEKADKSLSRAQMRDLRDMMTVLGSADFKPAKGRRKDLRKIDEVLSDLKVLAENW